MKIFLRTFFLCMLTMVTLTVSARAAEDILKVGLCYGEHALYSAGMQNVRGSGYRLGWFDEQSRAFHQIGQLAQERIAVTAGGTIYVSGGKYCQSRPARTDAVLGGYHVQLSAAFPSFEEAAQAARQLPDAFPAFVDGRHRVRTGSFTSRSAAEAAARAAFSWTDGSGAVRSAGGSAVGPSAAGVTVTDAASHTILFSFDGSGGRHLGIQPDGGGERAETGFNGCTWYGGFEFRRSAGGNIDVINVVELDSYVKGVLPYEMSPSWPLEALKAQAVCARTYALLPSRHYDSARFDVCATTDCQVYRGTGLASDLTDQAVEETAGVVAMYGGKYAETYFCSSNGGASESPENVWSGAVPYLVGKEDPYEGTTDIPDYAYTVTYTYSQLSRLLRDKGYSIGTVCGAYVSRTTPSGNAAEIIIRDTAGRTVKLERQDCRWVLGAKSMRFTISGGGGGLFVNDGRSPLAGLSGAYLLSGSGSSAYSGEAAYAVTASGTSRLQPSAAAGNGITITGTGWGHGVGMSQYGAKAMAELGKPYEEILDFYFTGITLERIQ